MENERRRQQREGARITAESSVAIPTPTSAHSEPNVRCHDIPTEVYKVNSEDDQPSFI